MQTPYVGKWGSQNARGNWRWVTYTYLWLFTAFYVKWQLSLAAACNCSRHRLPFSSSLHSVSCLCWNVLASIHRGKIRGEMPRSGRPLREYSSWLDWKVFVWKPQWHSLHHDAFEASEIFFHFDIIPVLLSMRLPLYGGRWLLRP